MKPNSCNTCALKVSLSQSDKVSALRVEEIYREFKRRNRKSNRIINASVGGDGSGDKTDFCALGSRHFKKGGVNCCQWVPAIGLSVSDALTVNLNRKLFWLTVAILFFTVLSVIGVFMSSKTPQPVPQKMEITTQSLPNKQNKIRDNQPSPKEQDKEINKKKTIEKSILKDNITKQSKDEIPQK